MMDIEYVCSCNPSLPILLNISLRFRLRMFASLPLQSRVLFLIFCKPICPSIFLLHSFTLQCSYSTFASIPICLKFPFTVMACHRIFSAESSMCFPTLHHPSPSIRRSTKYHTFPPLPCQPLLNFPISFLISPSFFLLPQILRFSTFSWSQSPSACTITFFQSSSFSPFSAPCSYSLLLHFLLPLHCHLCSTASALFHLSSTSYAYNLLLILCTWHHPPSHSSINLLLILSFLLIPTYSSSPSHSILLVLCSHLFSPIVSFSFTPSHHILLPRVLTFSSSHIIFSSSPSASVVLMYNCIRSYIIIIWYT